MTKHPRQNYASGAPWEDIVGYSRAVRIGPHVEVTGTVAIDGQGQPAHPGDAAAQTRRALEIIGQALQALGATYADVVRTRIYVTNIEHWEAIGRAHGAVFGAIKPATTLVEVSRLIDPAFLVEIEASAYVVD